MRRKYLWNFRQSHGILSQYEQFFRKVKHLSLLSSVILGFIQGVAEFLPISSSGHLAIAEHLLGMTGMEVPEFFDVLLHLGTLVAVFAAYWADIRDMVL